MEWALAAAVVLLFLFGYGLWQIIRLAKQSARERANREATQETVDVLQELSSRRKARDRQDLVRRIRRRRDESRLPDNQD